MAHYLVYWKLETVESNVSHSDSLRHTASAQYGKVRAGDVLWIITSEGPDDLLLVGRQCADKVVRQLEAERILKKPDLWPSDYHVISNKPEKKAYLDISRWARRLSFDGVVQQLPEGFTGRNLQSMRCLDYESEMLMERLWAKRHDTL